MAVAVAEVVAHGRFASLHDAARARRWYTDVRVQHQILGLGSVITVLLAWELLSRVGAVDARFIAAPSAVAEQMGTMLSTGTLQHELVATLTRLGAGYLLGVVAGIVVGFAMGMSRYVKAMLYPLLTGAYAVPKLALLPIVMMVLGLGDTAKIAMVAMTAFFMLPFNVMAAVENVDRTYVDVARNLGVGRLLYWRTVALPYALPMTFAGLRTAWAISLIVVVATELLASKDGLGFVIWKASQVFDTRTMYAGFVTLGILGYCSHLLLETVSSLAVPWRTDK